MKATRWWKRRRQTKPRAVTPIEEENNNALDDRNMLWRRGDVKAECAGVLDTTRSKEELETHQRKKEYIPRIIRPIRSWPINFDGHMEKRENYRYNRRNRETDTETVTIQREERGGQCQGRTDRLGGSRASWETGESKLIPLICNRLRRLGGVFRKWV